MLIHEVERQRVGSIFEILPHKGVLSVFLQLKDEINNQYVTVYRGAFGTVQSIPVRDLVVGDIVDINQGDRVPADCILIEEMNITVDQSMYYKK